MARPDSKAQAAAQAIRKRILHGDHAIHGVPAERPLAEELGMSRQTVRRSLKLLETEGFLVRQENGRLQVDAARNAEARRPIIGFVRHAYPSYDHELWAEGVHTAIEGSQVTMRSVTFEHYAAPHLAGALSGFDGMFFLPPAGSIPDWLLERMREEKCRVVVLDQDTSKLGLPSIVMFPPRVVSRLLEYLVESGHRRIDCLNVQERDPIIEGRISLWQSFLQQEGLEGSLYTLTEFRPAESAYQLVRNRLRKGHLLGSALLCTTGPAALGAMRACHDAGVKVGCDISICAVNDEGIGPYLMPSLTCLQSLPRAPYLRKALSWILSKEKWDGPLLLQPKEADVPLFIGESTGLAPGKGR